MKKILLKTINLLVIGIVIGVIIALYKYAVSFTLNLSNTYIINNNNYSKLLMIIPIIALLFISYYLINKDSNIKGSGMPNIEAYLLKHSKNFKWYTSLSFMFVNSLISVFCGIPVGTEAPSVFMGGTIGIAANKDDSDNDYIYSGLAAGFSAAFLNPFAGLFYVIEETIHKYKLKQIIKILFVSAIAFITSLLLNKEEIIHLSLKKAPTMQNYIIIIIILITNSIISYSLIKIISLIKKAIKKYPNISIVKYRFFFCFILFSSLLFIFPLISGSGLLILSYFKSNPIWYIALLLLLGRILLFILSNTSTITGGQLIPTFTIGALNGYLWSNIFSLQIDEYSIIILISMVSLFALVNKTPITSFLLIMSISGYNYLILIPALFSLIYTMIYSKIIKQTNITDTKRLIIYKQN